METGLLQEPGLPNANLKYPVEQFTVDCRMEQDAGKHMKFWQTNTTHAFRDLRIVQQHVTS